MESIFVNKAESKLTPEIERELNDFIIQNKQVGLVQDIDSKIAGMSIPIDTIEYVITSFKNEDNFITKYRPVCLETLLEIIKVSFLVIIGLIVLNLFKEVDTIALIASLSALVIEILGLLSIIFKYLFNRKDNKVLDIVSEIIKNIISTKKNK